jgi:hypothetical protein
MNDKTQRPIHYKKTIQPINYIIANNLNFCEGNGINIFFNYNLNVFHMLGIMLVLVAIALVMPFIFIYQLVKKWERE